MPRFEQKHRTKKTRSRESDSSAFPEEQVVVRANGGGKPEDIDEILERIDTALSEASVRGLGKAAGVKAD